MKCEFDKETDSRFYDKKARQSIKINCCVYKELNGWLEFISHLY